jgi:hypothetical protein
MEFKMRKIGFEISNEDANEQNETGAAEVAQFQSQDRWTNGLGEFFFEASIKFCTIYGMFAAIRDFVRSLL